MSNFGAPRMRRGSLGAVLAFRQRRRVVMVIRDPVAATSRLSTRPKVPLHVAEEIHHKA